MFVSLSKLVIRRIIWPVIESGKNCWSISEKRTKQLGLYNLECKTDCWFGASCLDLVRTGNVLDLFSPFIDPKLVLRRKLF